MSGSKDQSSGTRTKGNSIRQQQKNTHSWIPGLIVGLLLRLKRTEIHHFALEYSFVAIVQISHDWKFQWVEDLSKTTWG